MAKKTSPATQDKQQYLNKEDPNGRWDNYYAHYRRRPLISFIEWANRRIFTPAFLKRLYRITGERRGRKVLEPGCGAGLMSSLLARKNEVTLLDLSENALATARRTFAKQRARGSFVKGDLFRMPFRDGSFDVVWNQGVLEHFSDPVPAMREMMRVAKPGGYVVIFIPSFLSPLHFVWLFLSAFRLKRLWPFDEQEFYSQREFLRFLRRAGYHRPRVRRMWLSSFGMSQVGYARKPRADALHGSGLMPSSRKA